MRHQFANLDDLEVVRCVLQGNEKAYTELVQRHQTRIFQMAYSFTSNYDDADDLAQMAFVKAFRSLNRFEGHAQFATWLYRICMNCCYDWAKSRNRRIKVDKDDGWWASRSGNDALFAQDEAADQQVMDTEMQGLFEEALQMLEPEFRTVVVLREFNGLTYDEIADAVGCEVGTVKSRLFRARNRLQKLLAPVYAEWQAA